MTSEPKHVGSLTRRDAFAKDNLAQMADEYPWWVDRAKLKI